MTRPGQTERHPKPHLGPNLKSKLENHAMLSPLSNGRPGIRSSIQIEVHPPRTDELQRASHPSPADPQPDTKSQPILDFIASDETLDRYGEVISASGWHLDTYRRNPVFQNAHQYGDIMFTLGKALITEVRTTPHSALPTPHLYQRIQFATDINPVARVAYGLYKAKFLNAVSVGFIPLRWQDGGSASASGSAGGSPASPCRRRYLEQELLEVSAVGIPANPNALALGLKSGAIEKGDLQEILALLRDIGPLGPIGPLTTNLPHATRTLQLIHFARELHRILRRA
jgi:hypothetical protein